MATLYLTHNEIEDLMRAVVCLLLEIPDNDNKAIRFPYGSSAQTGSAPGIARDMDVCFVYIVPADDGYGQQRHVSFEPDPDGDMLTRVDEHTDIYDVRFVLYGPNSFERARRLKDGLTREDTRKLLKESGFFVRSGIPPLSHVQEIREGDWWTRYDVSPRFYSFVRIETPGFIGPIESASITTTL